MDTLATRLWTETGAGAYAGAAPYAAALVLLAAVPTYLLTRAQARLVADGTDREVGTAGAATVELERAGNR